MSKQYHFSETSKVWKNRGGTPWAYAQICTFFWTLVSYYPHQPGFPTPGSESPPHCFGSNVSEQIEILNALNGLLRTQVNQESCPHWAHEQREGLIWWIEKWPLQYGKYHTTEGQSWPLQMEARASLSNEKTASRHGNEPPMGRTTEKVPEKRAACTDLGKEGPRALGMTWKQQGQSKEHRADRWGQRTEQEVIQSVLRMNTDGRWGERGHKWPLLGLLSSRGRTHGIWPLNFRTGYIVCEPSHVQALMLMGRIQSDWGWYLMTPRIFGLKCLNRKILCESTGRGGSILSHLECEAMPPCLLDHH